MEKMDLERFPVSESARRMLSYVSDGFYDNSYVGKWLFEVMGSEYDGAREIFEELPYQFFPETATWGLACHEVKWGLPVRENLPYEQRRRLIYQKRDVWAPMTPYRMEMYLANVIGFEVHVADVGDPGPYGFVPDHPNKFKVYFVGDGMLDMEKVREMLGEIKQSHTVYGVNYRTETELDCRELENIALREMILRIRTHFFDCNMLDGRWPLDGSVLLNAHRPCRLGAGIMWDGIRFVMEVKHCAKVITSARIPAQERAGNALVTVRTGVKLRGKSERISLRMHTAMEEKSEEFGNISVTTQRNPWFLDGTVKLNGEKLLNAVYRKEIL